MGLGYLGRLFRRRALKDVNIEAERMAMFLRVGRFTLREFMRLSPESQAYVAEMADAMKADEIAALGLASQSKEAAAGVMARYDGGEAQRDVIMNRTLGTVVQRFRRERRA